VGEDLRPGSTAPNVGEVLAAEWRPVAVDECGDDVGVVLVRVTGEPLIPRDTLVVDRDLDPPASSRVGGVRVAQRDGVVPMRGRACGSCDGQESGCGGEGSGG
jgi:hypothetical protein